MPLVSGQSYAAVYSTGDYSGQTIGIHDINIYPNGQLLLGQSLTQLGTDAPIWTGFDTGLAGTFESAAAGAPEPSLFPILTLIAIVAALPKKRMGHGCTRMKTRTARYDVASS